MSIRPLQGNRPRSIIDASLTELVLFLVFALLLVVQVIVNERNGADERNRRLAAQVERLADLAADLGRTAAALAPDLVRLETTPLEGLSPEEALLQVDRFLKALDAALDTPEIRAALEQQSLADLIAAGSGQQAVLRQLAQLKAEIEKLRAERDSYRKVLEGRSSEDIRKLIDELAAAKAENARVARELGDVSGRLAELMARNRGLGPPACWPRPDGPKVWPILNVQLDDEGLFVTPAWPEDRSEEVKELALPTHLFNRRITIGEFTSGFRHVARAAEQRQCRYYVAMRRNCSTVQCRDNQDEVEKYFFKFFVRD